MDGWRKWGAERAWPADPEAAAPRTALKLQTLHSGQLLAVAALLPRAGVGFLSESRLLDPLVVQMRENKEDEAASKELGLPA